eukprot:5852958-Karenia_brevis.AAC.1
MDYIDLLFLDGRDPADGTKMLSAIMHFVPSVRAHTVFMERANKALTGWNKRAPGQGRKVFPEEVVYAVIGDL